jgi:hypothetical protein
VSEEESLEAWTERINKLHREAVYQTSLPRVPTITLTSLADVDGLIALYSRDAIGSLSHANVLTLIGMVLEATGNPAYSGFAEKYAHTLPELAEKPVEPPPSWADLSRP